MTVQITVRLPDELVAHMDEQVRQNPELTRTAYLARALERQRRREIAERDVAILLSGDGADDLSELARQASGTSLSDLD